MSQDNNYKDYKDYCNYCIQYENGFCIDIFENIDKNPIKFIEKCNGKNFLLNETIEIPRSVKKKLDKDTLCNYNYDELESDGEKYERDKETTIVESQNIDNYSENKRFLSERILFIITSGILPALFTQIPQLIIGIPLFVILFYIPAYIFFRIGGLTMTFEGEIPDWAKSKFSWKRFGMEYLYFFGIFAAGGLAIIIYRLITGQLGN